MLTRMGRLSMFWQIYLASAVLIVLSIGLLGVVIGAWVERNALQSIEDQLRSKAVLLQEVVRGRKVEEIQAQLKAMNQEFAVRITLIAPDGTVILESDRDDLENIENHARRPEVDAARSARFGIAKRDSTTVLKNMMYVAMRTETPHPEIAFVRVGMPTTEIHEHVANLRQLIWGTAGATALVGLLLAWALARRIALPLRELSEGAQRIGGGEYGHRVFIDRPDEVGQLAGTFNNMSQRLAEQFTLLDQDRQQLRAVLGGMVEGVIAVDADGAVLFANERVGRLLEFSVEQAVGRKLWEIVRHRPVQDAVQRVLTQPAHAPEQIDDTEAAGKHLAVHVAPLPGQPIRGAVLVFHDVTELRRLERVRQEFVANVSHELKTPLSVIVACAETLQGGALDDLENRGKFLERIAQQSQRLLTLIVDMISLARIESGAEQLDLHSVSLDDAVNACLERHQERARAKHQRLEAVPPAHPPTGGVLAWADTEAVSHILDNLVDNAIKYTPNDGVIQLHWWAEDSVTCLEVRDTGIGIPPSEVPRVFERFYRVDKARSRELGGTGLGLSIVKHFAQAMNGSVRVSSQVGQGSVFTLILPQPQKTLGPH